VAVQGSTVFELVANISHRDLKGHREKPKDSVNYRREKIPEVGIFDQHHGLTIWNCIIFKKFYTNPPEADKSYDLSLCRQLGGE